MKIETKLEDTKINKELIHTEIEKKFTDANINKKLNTEPLQN